MSDLNTRLHPVGTSVVGLIILLVLVVLIRAPADTPPPMDATEIADSGQESEPTAGIEADEPPLATGCFGSGSTRAEVSAVMGAPDSVVFGEWVYGRSGVTFGYGTVLDIRNVGGDLRVC